MSKNFSHLQTDIFCYFDSCHCRRNAFGLKIVCITGYDFFIFFSLEFTVRKCLLTENSENSNNKDLLRHIRTALSFPGLTLNLFGLKVTQNHYLNAVLKKGRGFVMEIWCFRVSKIARIHLWKQVSQSKKNHTMAAAASLTQKPSSLPRQRVWFGGRSLVCIKLPNSLGKSQTRP